MKHVNKSTLFLSGIFVIFFLLRTLSLTLQPVFCDEAIYIHWAQIIGGNFSHYAFLPLTDGKTPLFMWLMIPLLKVFSDPLVAGRVLSIFSGLATLWGVIYLGKKYFNLKVGLITALIIAVLPLTVFFDKLALTDSLLAAFSLWSLILALNLVHNPSLKNILLLGLTLGGGILTKTPGLFSFLTLPLVILAVNPKNAANKNLLRIIGSLFLATGVGYGIYNLLRLSPNFSQMSSRNQDYYFPISRLWQSPLNPFIPHLKDLMDWLPKLLTWPIFILIPISIGLTIYKKNLTTLAILLWGLMPLIAMMLLLKTFTARYILFSLIPLVFLSGWAISHLSKRILWGSLVLLIPALYFDFLLLTNPQKAPLPTEERRGYFEDWTAGYGLKEMANIFITQTKNQDILVVTQGFFGTLPDGLQIYLGNNPHIEVWYSPPTLNPEVYIVAKEKPVYFIVNKSQQVTNYNLQLLGVYPKAMAANQTQDALLLYRITP